MSTSAATTTTTSSSSSSSASSNGPTILSGTEVSKFVRGKITAQVSDIKAKGLVIPCLAVILVGSRKDSETYVSMKTKACVECGLRPLLITLEESVDTATVLSHVNKLNNDDSVHGILVQLPLPKHVHQDSVIESIRYDKDVDALTPINAGKLLALGDKAPLISCTPLGCLELLDYYNIPIAGKRAVVVGRSILVGKPVALLLLSRNATVSIAHSRTADLPSLLHDADIVIAAVGVAEFVRGDWLKKGSVVVDVGINSVDDATRKLGYRLVGDVNAEEAKSVVSAYSPVPGGVGPMTVAMLLKNTLAAYWLQQKK